MVSEKVVILRTHPLKLLIKDCDYAKGEEMVRDRIVFATNSPRVREKLLSQGPELTLEKAIDIACFYELAQVQLKAMANSSHELPSTLYLADTTSSGSPLASCQPRTSSRGEWMRHTRASREWPASWMTSLCSEKQKRSMTATSEPCSAEPERLNPDKCRICVSEVSYFGHRLTANGLKLDPLKVKAIRDMSPPENEAELETILGMVNYLTRFAPNLAEVTAPLRHLLRRDTEFEWDT